MGKTMRMSARIFLGFVFLFASVGIPLSQHLCGGEIVSTRIYAEAPSCGMPEEQGTGVGLDNPPCCQTQHALLAAQNLENDGPTSAIQIDPSVLPLFDDESALQIFSTPSGIQFEQAQGPPGPKPDLLALYQTYLI